MPHLEGWWWLGCCNHSTAVPLEDNRLICQPHIARQHFPLHLLHNFPFNRQPTPLWPTSNLHSSHLPNWTWSKPNSTSNFIYSDYSFSLCLSQILFQKKRWFYLKSLSIWLTVKLSVLCFTIAWSLRKYFIFSSNLSQYSNLFGWFFMFC